MTAKEKAMQIAMRFDKEGETDNAKKCALICVDEIIEIRKKDISNYEYWIKVKQEIEKL